VAITTLAERAWLLLAGTGRGDGTEDPLKRVAVSGIGSVGREAVEGGGTNLYPATESTMINK